MSETLSKSRILAVRQCRRRLWLEDRHPDRRIYDAAAQRRFAQGQQLNALVRRLYPDGRLIDEAWSTADALELTRSHLAHSPGRPLFEAAFRKHRTLVRADIFRRTTDGFELTEIKSSTRVKIHHLLDCALQNWVISEAGYPVARVVLAHIDTHFNYRGGSDYSGLLRHVDVTERVAELTGEIPGLIRDGLDVLSQTEEPVIATGPHCTRPFACPFTGHCSPATTAYPLSILPGGGHIIDQLRREGIEDVRQIPEGRLHKPLQQRVRQVTISREPHVGPEIKRTLLGLPYPRYYLDFESVQFAIPRWPDTRPYQQLPFQWSCHIERAPGDLGHREFLDTSGQAPMRACAEALIATLGSQGPIFSYSRYERTVMHQLAARFPDLAPQLAALAERLFDLLPLVKAHYYHPAMRGSYSVKAVLPTIAPALNYDGLTEVHDGVEAQLAYEKLIDTDTPQDRQNSLAAQLRAYCRLDTLAMVEMVRFFEER